MAVVLRGSANQVKSEKTIHGHGDAGVGTTFHYSFLLRGSRVQITATQPFGVEEGDEVVVAGHEDGKLIDVKAWRNITRGVGGTDSAVRDLFLFFLPLFALPVVFYSVESTLWRLVAGTLGIISLSIGGLLLISRIRAKRAVERASL